MMPIKSKTQSKGMRPDSPAPTAGIQELALAQLMEQISRRMHSLGHSEGLFPAQWAALRYFHHALPPNNTAISLARYQGLAVGPVTRTVRTLVEKGLIRKAGSAGPGRLEAIELTGDGKKMLARDPLRVIADVISELPHTERGLLANVFEKVVRELAQVSRTVASREISDHRSDKNR